MQIVRDLAGYTLGRSDLLRRAMSKKKQSVMEEERRSFVYGNQAENVLGCVANGISEAVANKIYDEMIDFAKYAFNKSHAAAYAVIAYQTAYLKYYYPVEFMAALMTSVLDHTTKVSEYILTSRKMGILILPPDINEGEGGFSVNGTQIRYGLSAIKNVGAPVIASLVEERKLNGPFLSLHDFLERMSGRDLNKRSVENFIKAGALDSLEGTRKQKMMVYVMIMDAISSSKKKVMVGQISLFELVAEEDKKDYEITMPDVGEFDKEQCLFDEKEVLGVYVSGHPLEEDEEKWRKNITAVTSDFELDEETQTTQIKDGEKVIVGGMIVERTIKYTKNGKTMAFLTIEDLLGTVEVIVFPRDYERNHRLIQLDAKVFVRGRANVEEERNGKIICEGIVSFEDTVKELWLKFLDMQEYQKLESTVMESLEQSEGKDSVVIYIDSTKQMKRLPSGFKIQVNQALMHNLIKILGENRVKVVEKSIENKS